MLPLHPWVRKCLDYLEKLPQIHAMATTEPYIDGEILTDGKLTITTQNEGQEINYLFVIKPDIIIEYLEKQLEYLFYLRQRLDSSQRLLLISKDLSDYVIDTLLEKNIEFLDANGTIYLNNSSFYILIRNLDQQASNYYLEIPTYNKEPINLTVDDLKVMFVILKEAETLKDKWQLSEFSGIYYSIVNDTLSKLIKLEYITSEYNINPQDIDFKKLFQRWEIGYIERLRPSLFINSFRVLQDSCIFENSTRLANYLRSQNLLIGGELGVQWLTKYFNAQKLVVHLPEFINDRQTMIDLRLVPDIRGDVTFLKQFGTQNQWNNDDKYPIADPLLIHAELMIDPDSRLKEMANIIYEQKIAPRFHQ